MGESNNDLYRKNYFINASKRLKLSYFGDGHFFFESYFFSLSSREN